MAKPNYSFEKRQRELAKKKKQEEKDAKKRDAKASAQPDDATPPADEPASPVTTDTDTTVARPKVHLRSTKTADAGS
ncbi:MAG: hypothetical protein E6Q50_11550 [Lysobacter sp.]|nr:MAG: hypothetical protein E6Q50_11550 [Lysobacter sp.]